MATTFLEPGTDATFDFSLFPITAVVVGNSLSSATDQVNTGPRSIKSVVTVVNSNAYCVTPNGVVADAGALVSAFVRFSSVAPSVNTGFIGVEQADDGSSTLGISLDTNGTLAICANTVADFTKVNGATVLVADTWYRISFAYVITSTTNWSCKLYLNGCWRKP